MLPAKVIPVSERLIFPLDVPTWDEAKALVETLGDTVQFYKLGLQLLVAAGSPGYYDMASWLAKDCGKKVMADLKMFDISRTVAAAVKSMRGSGAEFVTVHGNDNMLKAAADAKDGSIKVLAVTVLTSITEEEQRQFGFQGSIKELVLSRAKRALELQCDGVVSSGMEVPALRQLLGDRFAIVVPGVRPGVNDEVGDLQVQGDDQQRTATIHRAFDDGADYIVVGRPIRHAKDPKDAATRIQGSIKAWFDKNPVGSPHP